MKEVVGTRYHACSLSLRRQSIPSFHSRPTETDAADHVLHLTLPRVCYWRGLLGQRHGKYHHEYKTLTKPKALSGNSMLATLLLQQDLSAGDFSGRGEISRFSRRYPFSQTTTVPPFFLLFFCWPARKGRCGTRGGLRPIGKLFRAIHS